ncbi:MAG: nuclear transport factor 2 family protein [Halobacteriales archaeon]|nr:nuclear transport factor 2 family protein [Halobacteriales archaeon]
MDRHDTAERYYHSIDADEYEALRALLADDFVHDRGDMRLDGRDAFVAFMRDERPDTETSHELAAIYESDAGIAAEGTLRRASGEVMFSFVDTFRFEDGVIRALTTYTHSA